MTSPSKRRLGPTLILAIMSLTWLAVLLRQHSLVDKVLRDHALARPAVYDSTTVQQQLRFQGQQPLTSALQQEQPRQEDKQQLAPHSSNKLFRPTKSNFSLPLTRPKEPRMYFINYPLTLVESASSVQSPSQYCLDESMPQHGNISWQFTSCHYTNSLCFNVQTLKYELLMGGAGNSAASIPVALGGINPRWEVGSGDDRGSHKVQWRPEMRREPLQQYYQLPPNVILVPFSSFAGHNVGHLLWDDFFAIFRLLQLHGLVGSETESAASSFEILPIRQVLEEKLYATCDIRRNKRLQCMDNFVKFLPLMGVHPQHFSTHKRVNFTGNAWPKSQLVCSQQAVAGLGMLTDHGKHDHGWDVRRPDELLIPHMLGKGRLFWDFRQFMLRNLGMKDVSSAETTRQQPRITFSLQSSRDWDRRLNFTRQIQALESALAPATALISPLTLWQMPLSEQIQTALDSDIFISTCGGGSMTASFLPRGASLILFYNETGGLDFETFSSNAAPARLDWDLLGNAAHLRVHWLPVGAMDSVDDLALFVKLVQHELRAIQMVQ